MATVLENYQSLRREVEARIAEGNAPLAAVWWYGEVTYRIAVLETLKAFGATAPLSTEAPELVSHYRLLDACIQSLATERRYGPDRGPDTQKERDAAQTNLGRVIVDYRKRFASFSPSTPETYRHAVGGLINTVLPAWLQFRETFVPLKKTKKEAPAA